MTRAASCSRLAIAVAVVLLAGQAAAAPALAGAPVAAWHARGGSGPAPSEEPVQPSLGELVGQKLVIRMDGTTPSAGLLARIRRGEVGGIVLFGFNITTRTELVAVTGSLQAAAAAGDQPPLLIMVDQEGGGVRRIPWAPPTLSPRQMSADGRSSAAREQGKRTGAALAALGVNVNLAPVVDLPRSRAAFMYWRAFSGSATRTSRLANAFAEGVLARGVVPVIKHFPGIGRATRNTDRNAETVRATRRSLERDLLPFRRAVAAGAPMIMLSNATYTAFDPDNGAGWSSALNDLLRGDLGFTGVTITDSLTGTSGAYGIPIHDLSARAARSGTDMLMLTGSEPATAKSFDHLLDQAGSGSIPLATLHASYDRIVTLKSGL